MTFLSYYVHPVKSGVEYNEEVCENAEIPVSKRCWGSSHQMLISDFYDNNKYFGIESVDNTYKALFAMYESARKNGAEVSVK